MKFGKLSILATVTTAAFFCTVIPGKSWGFKIWRVAPGLLLWRGDRDLSVRRGFLQRLGSLRSRLRTLRQQVGRQHPGTIDLKERIQRSISIAIFTTLILCWHEPLFRAETAERGG